MYKLQIFKCDTPFLFKMTCFIIFIQNYDFHINISIRTGVKKKCYGHVHKFKKYVIKIIPGERIQFILFVIDKKMYNM